MLAAPVPTFARWFWNQTCTTRTLSPVSAASVSRTWDRAVTVASLSPLSCSGGLHSQGKPMLSTQDIPRSWRQLGMGPSPHTFLQGLEETSKDALNALRCCVVRMVRGLLGRL